MPWFVGYRHFDCAWLYNNETGIGRGIAQALKEGICRREDLFVTTKLSPVHFSDVRGGFQQSLERLGLDYIDLYLMHYPFQFRADPQVRANKDLTPAHMIGYDANLISRTWSQLEELYDSGKTRTIGVSKFSIKKLECLLRTARVVPAVNQCEVQPYFQQHKLRAYCRSNGVVFQGYNSLGTPSPVKSNVSGLTRVMETEEVREIGEKHGATPAQVCLAFAMSLGDIVIPKTTSEHRLTENLSAVSFQLDELDMATLKGMDRGIRYQDLSWFFPAEATLDDIWDTDYDYNYLLE